MSSGKLPGSRLRRGARLVVARRRGDSRSSSRAASDDVATGLRRQSLSQEGASSSGSEQALPPLRMPRRAVRRQATPSHSSGESEDKGLQAHAGGETRSRNSDFGQAVQGAGRRSGQRTLSSMEGFRQLPRSQFVQPAHASLPNLTPTLEFRNAFDAGLFCMQYGCFCTGRAGVDAEGICLACRHHFASSHYALNKNAVLEHYSAVHRNRPADACYFSDCTCALFAGSPARDERDLCATCLHPAWAHYASRSADAVALRIRDEHRGKPCRIYMCLCVSCIPRIGTPNMTLICAACSHLLRVHHDALSEEELQLRSRLEDAAYLPCLYGGGTGVRTPLQVLAEPMGTPSLASEEPDEQALLRGAFCHPPGLCRCPGYQPVREHMTKDWVRMCATARTSIDKAVLEAPSCAVCGHSAASHTGLARSVRNELHRMPAGTPLVVADVPTCTLALSAAAFAVPPLCPSHSASALSVAPRDICLIATPTGASTVILTGRTGAASALLQTVGPELNYLDVNTRFFASEAYLFLLSSCHARFLPALSAPAAGTGADARSGAAAAAGAGAAAAPVPAARAPVLTTLVALDGTYDAATNQSLWLGGCDNGDVRLIDISAPGAPSTLHMWSAAKEPGVQRDMFCTPLVSLALLLHCRLVCALARSGALAVYAFGHAGRASADCVGPCAGGLLLLDLARGERATCLVACCVARDGHGSEHALCIGTSAGAVLSVHLAVTGDGESTPVQCLVLNQVREHLAPYGAVSALAWSRDEPPSYLAVGTEADAVLVLARQPAGGPAPLRLAACLKAGHRSFVTCIDWGLLDDGRHVLVSGGLDGLVLFWGPFDAHAVEWPQAPSGAIVEQNCDPVLSVRLVAGGFVLALVRDSARGLAVVGYRL